MFSGNKKWLYIVLLSIIWGSSFILIKKALTGFTPLQLGSLRIIISGIFLFIIGFKTLKQLTRNSLKWIVISGFLGTFFPAFLFAFAETEIDSAIASILNSLVPLNAMLLGFMIFRISSTRGQIIGVIIGFIGTAFLILNGAAINPDQNYLYALFVVLATLMYAVNSNIVKRYLQDVPALAIAVGNFAVIIIPAFAILIYDDFFTAEVFESPDFKLSLFYILLLSIFGTAIAKVFYNKLIQISTPVFASSVTYLMPIVAVLWGVLDGEGFSFWQGAATGIILLGVYLSNAKKRSV